MQGHLIDVYFTILEQARVIRFDSCLEVTLFGRPSLNVFNSYKFWALIDKHCCRNYAKPHKNLYALSEKRAKRERM